MKKSTASFAAVFAPFLCMVLFAGDQAQPAPLLPDLTVTFVSPGALKEPRATIGEDISGRIQLRVDNRGQAAVKRFGVAVVFSSSPSIVFSPIVHAPILSGRAIWQNEVETSLAPGGSQVISVSPFRIPDDISWGDYYLTAIVDAEKKVAESNENNNQAQLSIFVMARADYIEQCCTPGPKVGAHGKGFGTWKSTVVVRVGPYTLATQPANWQDDAVHAPVAPGQIPLSLQRYDMGVYNGSKPICKIFQGVWAVWIQQINPPSGAPGTHVTITCCTCGASQGTKKVYLCDQTGNQCAAEMPVVSWSDQQIIVTVPPVAPGQYYVYLKDGGQSIMWIHGDPFTVN